MQLLNILISKKGKTENVTSKIFNLERSLFNKKKQNKTYMISGYRITGFIYLFYFLFRQIKILN